MLTTSAHSVPSGADRSGQPAWRRFVAVVLIALLSPVPALFAFWVDASDDGAPDTWVDPSSGAVFTLSELDAFSWDIDGDGLANAQELQLGTDPFVADTDGDGLWDAFDPLPLDSSNSSQANGIVWGAFAMDDADGDGISNFTDADPYGTGGPAVDPDGDGDGIPDLIDPAPGDPYNISPANGLPWMGDALADADADGVVNFHDWYPYDASRWDAVTDGDHDGIPDGSDPNPNDSSNHSFANGISWGADAFGDSDADGVFNFYDAYPYDSGNGYVPSEPDADGDGIPDSSDPSPWDYYNYSAANGVSWQGDARGDADNDGISNFYDQFPYDYYNGNMPVSDQDGDGIPDAEDPAPSDPTNLSPVNGGMWYTAALADADGDGNPNFTDPWPYDPTNGNLPPEWNSPTADTDADGIPNAQDPALADPLNFSIYNGTSWYADAIGDLDLDGIVNFQDSYPYDYYNGSYAGPDSDGDGITDSSDPYPNDPNNGNDDADGDGIVDSQDSYPYDATNGSGGTGGGGDPQPEPDTDGDGRPDSQDPYPNDPYDNADFDQDGIPDVSDPAQADANNLSPINAIEWFGDVRGDADEDGVQNFWDLEPYGPPSVDVDGDGLIDSVDPAPEDFYNLSPHNGAQWQADALGDFDGDGVPNFFDAWPDDRLNGQSDADMDGIPDPSDPAPQDSMNFSPHNGRYWHGSEVLGDADNDGRLNFFDRHPEDFYDGDPPVTDPDSDGDGLADSVDPAPGDYYNLSPHNDLYWPGDSAIADDDGDIIINFNDLEPYPKLPEPEPGPSCTCPLPSAPTVSASTFVLLNDNFDELIGPWTPESKRDYQTDKLFGKDAEGNSRIVIEGLMPLAMSLPDGYANGQRSIVIRQSGVGEVRIHAVRGNDQDEIVDDGMGVVLKQGDGWQYWVEGTRAGQVMLEYEFPESGEYREAKRPGGCASSDCRYAYYDWLLAEPATNNKGELTLQVVPAEVVVRKKTEAAAPETGLLVKKGDVIIFDVNGSAPAGEFPFPPESVKWKVRQLKHDGTTTEWADVQGQGAEVDYMTNQGGVFEAKAVVTPPGGKASDFPLTRKKDAPHSSDSKGAEQDIHKAGAVDYFGVADQQWQIDLREKALADLGSDKYKTNGVFKTPWFPNTKYGEGRHKCNVFVYHKCYEAGIEVPLTRGGSEWLGFRTSPPLAIDWWNDNRGRRDMADRIITSVEIPLWSRLPDDAMPQPGLIVSRPKLGGAPDNYDTHVGIFDYDGSWISAGLFNVNKYCHPKNCQPQGVRKYISGN